MMKVKVTLMSAVEPEMRRMSFGDNPDFGDLKKKVSELFNETDTEMLFQWKGKTDKNMQLFYVRFFPQMSSLHFFLKKYLIEKTDRNFFCT